MEIGRSSWQIDLCYLHFRELCEPWLDSTAPCCSWERHTCLISSRGELRFYGWSVVLLGVPAGIGMVLWRPWGRVLGLLFFTMWLIYAIAFISLASGFTHSNISLLIAALGGFATVYCWE